MTIRIFASACILLLSSNVLAVPIVFTDRTLWEAAVGPVITEDFNDQFIGQVGPATTFTSGLSLITNSDIRTFGFGDIGEGLALNGTSQTIILPGSNIAFGFDYVDVDLGGVDISFGGFIDSLIMTGDADSSVTPDDFGFYGVILSSAAELPGGTFTFSGEGFTIDNLSFSARQAVVPEPSSIYLISLALLGLSLQRRLKFGKL